MKTLYILPLITIFSFLSFFFNNIFLVFSFFFLYTFFWKKILFFIFYTLNIYHSTLSLFITLHLAYLYHSFCSYLYPFVICFLIFFFTLSFLNHYTKTKELVFHTKELVFHCSNCNIIPFFCYTKNYYILFYVSIDFLINDYIFTRYKIILITLIH